MVAIGSNVLFLCLLVLIIVPAVDSIGGYFHGKTKEEVEHVFNSIGDLQNLLLGLRSKLITLPGKKTVSGKEVKVFNERLFHENSSDIVKRLLAFSWTIFEANVPKEVLRFKLAGETPDNKELHDDLFDYQLTLWFSKIVARMDKVSSKLSSHVKQNRRIHELMRETPEMAGHNPNSQSIFDGDTYATELSLAEISRNVTIKMMAEELDQSALALRLSMRGQLGKHSLTDKHLEKITHIPVLLDAEALMGVDFDTTTEL